MKNKVKRNINLIIILSLLVCNTFTVSPSELEKSSQHYESVDQGISIGEELLQATTGSMLKARGIVERESMDQIVERFEEDKRIREEEEARERARLAEIARIEEERRIEQEKIRNRQIYKDNIVVNSSNINQSSNLSLEHMREILKATGLEGTEYAFYKIDRAGINFFFAVSVSIQETGWATNSARARSRNDVFGITSVNRYYKSKQECIYYFGDFMQRLYIDKGLSSVDVINTKYCPSTTEWAPGVKSHMKKLFNMALNIMG